MPTISGYICSKVFNIPHVITFHDVYQAQDSQFWKEWMRKTDQNTPFYAPTAARLIERIVLKMNPSVYHTVSDMSRNDLLKFRSPESKIQVIPNGIDIQDYGPENKTLEPALSNIIFVGRLVYYKNIETIIAAFKEVRKSIP